VSVTELRANLFKILNQCADEKAPVVVERDDHPVALIVQLPGEGPLAPPLAREAAEAGVPPQEPEGSLADVWPVQLLVSQRLRAPLRPQIRPLPAPPALHIAPGMEVPIIRHTGDHNMRP
jgi:hypothetical protein